MGYLLRMSDEIHDWLTDLHRSDPPTAMSVARALTALMSEGASLGPPLVIPVADSAPPEDLMAALDSSYEDRLERLKAVRRRVAETAMLVRDLQDRLAELESAQSPESTEVRLLLARMTAAERRLQVRSQRLQARIDAFRTRKEVLKARYTAARAELPKSRPPRPRWSTGTALARWPSSAPGSASPRPKSPTGWASARSECRPSSAPNPTLPRSEPWPATSRPSAAA
ncbi:MAG TPA: hypothetical protein VIY52_16550 [Streptosporangiaceae bacterium]